MKNWKLKKLVRPITRSSKTKNSPLSSAPSPKTGNFANWKKEPLEKDIQAAIINYLDLMNIEYAVTDASRAFGRDGRPRRSKVSPDHPDLSCVLPVIAGGLKVGLAFYIECKTKTGRASIGQKAKLTALAEQGAICLVARSVEDVINVITRYKGKEWTQDAKAYMDQLLQLSISDRRSRTVRNALSELTDNKGDDEKPKEKQ